MARIPHDAYRAATNRARRWLKRDEVLAVSLGLRSRAGRLVRDEVCVVVTVRWKRSPERLKSRGEKPLPSHIDVVLSGKNHRIPVDVEGAGGRVAGKLHGIIGSPLVATASTGGARRYGMVGCIVNENGSKVILASGHVVASPAARVTVNFPGGSVDGLATRVFLQGNLDHALITPDDPLASNAISLPPGQRLAGVRTSNTIKQNDDVFFYDQDREQHAARVAKTDAVAPFNTPVGRKNFDHLIGIVADSRKGDSGTLLYDDKPRAGRRQSSFPNRDN